MKNQFVLFILATTFLTLQAQDLKEKVAAIMPLDKTLSIIKSGGSVGSEAIFKRNSIAYTPDFRKVERDVPRYISKGLLIENGSLTLERGTKNFLSNQLATLDTTAGLPVEGKAETVTGLEGKGALRLQGALKLDVNYPFAGKFVLSFYLKNGEIKVTEKGKDLKTFTAANEWQRCWIILDAGKQKGATTTVTLTASKAADLDAMMLEGVQQHYLSRTTPSTWLPGETARASDSLLIPLPENLTAAGAISMRYTPTALGSWMCLTSSGAWKPGISISVTNTGNRMNAILWDKQLQVTKGIKFEVGKEYSILLTWNEQKSELYVDGKKVGETAIPPVAERQLPKNIAVGGSVGEGSPNIRAEGIIRDYAIWKSAISTEEAGKIAAITDLKSLFPATHVLNLIPLKTFGREDGAMTLAWRVDKKLQRATVTLAPLPESAAQFKDGVLTWKFHPSLLMPGDYSLSLNCQYADRSTETVKQTITIVPARTPWQNIQICTWNESADNYAELGVTLGGTQEWNPTLFDSFTRHGLYTEYNWVFLGNGRANEPGDWAVDHDGKRKYASILSPYVRESVVKEAADMARKLSNVPSVKMLIINTERHAGSTSFDFSEPVIAMLKSKFGIDLNQWRDSGQKEWQLYRPLGWLSTLKQTIPPNRIVKDNDPFYQMHRWWHGPEGASDVITNDLLAEGVNRVHPEVITAKEPISRRPPLRSHHKVNVAQDWTYYPDLNTIPGTAEMVGALSRYNEGMTPSTMPQFLLKPGMAAPFEAMPTRDMLREAVWLVCSRPTRVMTFWNAHNAFNKKEQYTAPEIRALIGDETDAKKIAEKKLNIKAWEPGLDEEFKSLSATLWKPFGALLPQWRNAPRRVALVCSFVSQIYGNQRWPSGGWMQTAMTVSGVPYDVLLDDDLEMKDFPMQYDAIILPNIQYLTESMVANLKKAQASGCKLIVDDAFKIDIPGIIRLAKITQEPTVSAEELELLKKFGGKTDSPQYVEAMEEKARELNTSSSPELNALLRQLPRNAVNCLTDQVYWNLLEADGVSYLVAVNDRRIPGELYGRFGKVREKGVPQTAEFELKGNWKYAWDLTSGKAIKLSGNLKLDLPSCAGRIVMLSSQPIGKLSVKGSATAIRGHHHPVSFEMKSSGLIPLELSLISPDGKKDSISHFTVLKSGRCSWSIPIPANAPAGTWKVRARELASNQQCELGFMVK